VSETVALGKLHWGQNRRKGQEQLCPVYAGLARPPTMLIPLEIETLPCHLACVIARQASPANVGPHGVDRACRRDAYVSHERRTSIAITSHVPLVAIDVRAGDSVEVGVALQ